LTPELHRNQLKEDKSGLKDSEEGDSKSGLGRACKILLLFSEDGVAASDLAVSLAEQVVVEVTRIRFR
jgi:hypothetical protein